jgi:hypothetical protein
VNRQRVHDRPATLRIPARAPITFDDDGQPIIDTSILTDAITFDDVPYMTRYYLTRNLTATIRLHHLHTSDPGRDLHDHPWDFVSLLLTGAYRETTPDGDVEYEAPCIVTRQAEQLHRLELLDGPMWTLVTTGSVRRQWGFGTAAGWVPAREYPDMGRYA